MRKRLTTLLLGTVLVVASNGCSHDPGTGATPTPNPASPTPDVVSPASSAVSWPAPADPMARAAAAGLKPEPREIFTHHVHAHLDIFLDGKTVIVPAGIGINTKDPGVRTFTDPVAYGGIEMCDKPCISPLHTHAEDGVLHTESPRPEPNTLAQLFIEWGLPLTPTCVNDQCAPQKTIAYYVDGTAFTGDPRTLALTNGREIAIVIGTPPAEVPKTYDFSQA